VGSVQVGNGGNFPPLVTLGQYLPGMRIFISRVAEVNANPNLTATDRAKVLITRDVSTVTQKNASPGWIDTARAPAAGAAEKGLQPHQFRIDAENQGEITVAEFCTVQLEYTGTSPFVAFPIELTYNVLTLQPAAKVLLDTPDWRGRMALISQLAGEDVSRYFEGISTPTDTRPGARIYPNTTVVASGTIFFPSPGARTFAVMSVGNVTANLNYGTVRTSGAIPVVQNVPIPWSNATSVTLTSVGATDIVISEQVVW
jgi:hypothetical protein